MPAGGDFLIDPDHQRKDRAGLPLRAVPDVPASTTAIALGKRFCPEVSRGVERANAALVRKVFSLLPKKRREQLMATRPTIDLGPADVEVYGPNKQGTGYNYIGQRAYRPHPAVRPEAGWALAAELGSGRSDPRPQAPAPKPQPPAPKPQPPSPRPHRTGGLGPARGVAPPDSRVAILAFSTPRSPGRRWRTELTSRSQ
jgi:hypothetical protein